MLIGTPFVFSHAFVSLFTTTLPVGSVQSLLIGGLTAFAAGGVAGAIIAHCYNLAGRVFSDRYWAQENGGNGPIASFSHRAAVSQ